MSVLPQIAVQATSIVTLALFVGGMPPDTCKVASKEASKEITKEVVEVTNPTIPIYAGTQ